MNRSQYIAALQKLNAKPPGKNSKKQKFRRGTLVYDNDICTMYHGQGEGKPTTCVVEYTYKQKYGGNARQGKIYSVIILDKNMNPVNTLAWRDEGQLRLTEVGEDTELGFKIIELYGDKS